MCWGAMVDPCSSHRPTPNEDKSLSPLRSRDVPGGRYPGRGSVDAGAHGFFLAWQSHSSTVPRIKTAPAGIPITTGQGRLAVEDEGATRGPGGLGSAREIKDRSREGNVITLKRQPAQV